MSIASTAEFNKDYHSVLKYSEKLNETLSIKYKVPENLRPLLVSGILIALRVREFEDSDSINEQLVDAITEQLGRNPELLECYGFIRTHKQLQSGLYELISDIDNTIFSFIKKYPYFDILGKFYTEFLKCANGDKALGIVLTPPHIAEFFAEITEVNKDSVVIDSCTGTGGFLIAAMKKMQDSNQDNTKQDQLIGIEEQSHIFALGASNMIIHNCGKVYHNSCFGKIDDKPITEFIREKYKPNIGMLNPPYRKKKKGLSEWRFVLNNLSMLTIGGKCAAIIPMSCVIACNGEDLELKKELLKHHTLDAVFSMPDKLFYPASVITSIVLITAHKPHNQDTYLGFYKDDGFVMKRHKGRLDYYNRWESVKKEWIDGFKNKQQKPGFAVVTKLKPEDEWCAENYMETDYSKLTQSDFEKVLRDYIGYKFINGLS